MKLTPAYKREVWLYSLSMGCPLHCIALIIEPIPVAHLFPPIQPQQISVSKPFYPFYLSYISLYLIRTDAKPKNGLSEICDVAAWNCCCAALRWFRSWATNWNLPRWEECLERSLMSGTTGLAVACKIGATNSLQITGIRLI